MGVEGGEGWVGGIGCRGGHCDLGSRICELVGLVRRRAENCQGHLALKTSLYR